MRTLTAISAFSLALSALWTPIAKADSGNYTFSTKRGEGIVLWEIIDPDPAGLNCRIHRKDHGIALDAMNAPNYHEPEMLNGGYIKVTQWWEPLTSLKTGTQVEAVVGHFVMQHSIKDFNYKPWLAVRTPQGDCFVRAHKSLIRPAQNQPKRW